MQSTLIRINNLDAFVNHVKAQRGKHISAAVADQLIEYAQYLLSNTSENAVSPSQAYVQAMGIGWNVFNTFDSLNTDDISKSDETAWGQPRVTQELILSSTGSITTQDKLDMINQAAYEAIRSSGGNNATRMIIVPTYYTSADVDKADATYNFIAGLNDPNIIATVHFYSDWVFTANLGITSFDEPLYTGMTDTARSNIDLLFDTLNNSFISKSVVKL